MKIGLRYEGKCRLCVLDQCDCCNQCLETLGEIHQNHSYFIFSQILSLNMILWSFLLHKSYLVCLVLSTPIMFLLQPLWNLPWWSLLIVLMWRGELNRCTYVPGSTSHSTDRPIFYLLVIHYKDAKNFFIEYTFSIHKANIFNK